MILTSGSPVVLQSPNKTRHRMVWSVRKFEYGLDFEIKNIVAGEK